MKPENINKAWQVAHVRGGENENCIIKVFFSNQRVYLLLPCLILRHWGWKQYVSPKHREIFSRLHTFTFKRIAFFVLTAVGTSKLNYVIIIFTYAFMSIISLCILVHTWKCFHINECELRRDDGYTSVCLILISPGCHVKLQETVVITD
jgi:hypothetical protein